MITMAIMMQTKMKMLNRWDALTLNVMVARMDWRDLLVCATYINTGCDSRPTTWASLSLSCCASTLGGRFCSCQNCTLEEHCPRLGLDTCLDNANQTWKLGGAPIKQDCCNNFRNKICINTRCSSTYKVRRFTACRFPDSTGIAFQML